jgi:hypothetical protein
MIKDHRTIEIKATPDQVFKELEHDLFPTFKLLDTRFFLFFRLALIDSIRSGWRCAGYLTDPRTFHRDLQVPGVAICYRILSG